jgi:hypothetical protein
MVTHQSTGYVTQQTHSPKCGKIQSRKGKHDLTVELLAEVLPTEGDIRFEMLSSLERGGRCFLNRLSISKAFARTRRSQCNNWTFAPLSSRFYSNDRYGSRTGEALRIRQKVLDPDTPVQEEFRKWANRKTVASGTG